MGGLLEMNPQGRVTIPAEVRRALRLTPSTRFEWEVRDAGLFLKPVVTVPAEDAWAFTPQHIAQLHRAVEQRGYALGPDDLERVASDAEAAHARGEEFRVRESDLNRMERRNVHDAAGRFPPRSTRSRSAGSTKSKPPRSKS